MKHYNYDRETRKYLGYAKCQVCPITKKDLFPANSTPIAPPKCEKDEFQVFKDGQWSIEIDHKKRVQRNAETMKLENGVAVEMSEEDKQARRDKKEAHRLKNEAQEFISQMQQLANERAIESFLTKQEKEALQAAKLLINS
jgi:hypothetical protein